MARDTKTDTHNLALALDAIRRDLPTAARYALFETSDQNMGYGFWFHGVAQGPDGGPELEASDSLFNEVRDYVEDIDWNGVMGENEQGYAKIDLTTAVSHDFPDRPACTTCPREQRVSITDPEGCLIVVVEVGGAPVEFTIHPSKSHPGAVNVEIDGELRGRVRVHMNDRLILDSLNDIHEIEDPRPESATVDTDA